MIDPLSIAYVLGFLNARQSRGAKNPYSVRNYPASALIFVSLKNKSPARIFFPIGKQIEGAKCELAGEIRPIDNAKFATRQRTCMHARNGTE